MYRISANRISEIFTLLQNDRRLYVPVRSGNQAAFGLWEPGTTCCLEQTKTGLSLKEFFFPQSERLVDFQRKGQSIAVLENQQEEEPFVVFGARSCDVKAMEILDSVFLSEPCDSFYKAKREKGTIITVACDSPEESCFCKAFGIEASEPAGDVVVWMTGDTLYWEAKTDQGQKITQIVSGLLEPTEETEDAALVQYKESIREKTGKLPLSSINPASVGSDLQDLFQSDVWEDLSRTCLGCGVCTFVCPTCQCYDIQDYDTGHGIQRSRCWDSCMYSDFTLMAHGNPRTSQLERFRQRFMHKLVYFPENNNGEYSCVGCGRCITKCPVSLNIAKVIKVLGGRENVRE